MFANAKIILITTESHEVIVIRGDGQHTVQGYCPVCGSVVEMMSLDMAVNHSGIGGRELVYRSDGGEVHSIESPAGHLLFCKVSLTNVFGTGGALTCPFLTENGDVP